MIGLVIGGAPSVWADFERACQLTEGLPTVVIATNHAGRLYEGRIDAWVTLHPEWFEPWRDERAAKGLNTDYRALVYAGKHRVPGAEPWKQRWNASSGLFAAQLALDAMGCTGVILCGVPIDKEAGHITAPGEWKLADRYRQGVLDAKAEGAPIRSMGGWTADVLGSPSPAWLRSLGFNVPVGRKLVRPRKKEIAMRVTFKKDYDYTPSAERRVTIAYKAGDELTVKREAGEAAVAAGAAVEIDAPATVEPEPEKAQPKASKAKAGD